MTSQIDSSPRLTLSVEPALFQPAVPSYKQFETWFKHVEAHDIPSQQIDIQVIDTKTMSQLNATFRNKYGPTNVLSFPSPDGQTPGNIALCAPIISTEATEAGIPEANHWCHLTIHAILHLSGFDHQTDTEAAVMQQKEIQVLDSLQIPNPYEQTL